MARVLVLGHPDSRDPGLVSERAAEAGVELEVWVSAEAPAPSRDPAEYDGLLVLGGGINVKDAPVTPWLRDEIALIGDAVERGTPVLGICLGHQLLAAATGGDVERSPAPEVGWYDVELTPEGREDALFGALPERFTAYQWHSYIAQPPAGATVLAENGTCLQGFRLGERAWGVQFHPEVTERVLGIWIPDYPTDADAARVGGDPEQALAEVPRRLPAWNAVGRALFDRYLAVVTSSRSRAPAA
jgi:GMP synthase-like glutamine amidotransferase